VGHILSYPDGLLRGHMGWVEGGNTRLRLLQLLVILTVFGMSYGAVMGSYGGFTGSRALQMLFAGLKVPLLLLCTFSLSLPSFFVINSLFGLRGDFVQAVRALIAAQAGLTIILASFAPITAVWYLSFAHYNAAILFNAVMFGCASLAAQLLLRQFYRPLIARNPRHRLLLRGWIVIYAFVGVQMGWVLRPFIGAPDAPVRFFREGAWGNGYVELFNTLARALSG
jgi:hypothetical protein